MGAFSLLVVLSALVVTTSQTDEPQRGAVLRVGASGDYPPFSERVDSPTSTGESYRGLDAAIARRFASDRGFEIEWIAFQWPGLVTALTSGRFDVAMSGVTVRPDRSVAGRFTVPVALSGAVVLVRNPALVAALSGLDPNSKLRRIDRSEIRIAVNAGGHLERVARAQFRNALVRAIPDNAAVRDALARGDVEAVVTDTLEVEGWRAGLSGTAVVGPFTRDRKAYLLPADASDLARSLDRWLMDAERDGTLAVLRAEWLPASRQRRDDRPATPINALLAAVDERLALMPFVAESKRRSGAPIVDRVREARVLAAAEQAVREAAAASGLPRPAVADVRAFYRAQIDAAVAIQRRAPASGSLAGAPFHLVREIRPALLRIGERMAFLLVRVAEGPAVVDLDGVVAAALAGHHLPPERYAAIARAIEAVGGGGRAARSGG